MCTAYVKWVNQTDRRAPEKKACSAVGVRLEDRQLPDRSTYIVRETHWYLEHDLG